MVLYCLVPYLVCMVALLRLIRLQKETEFTDMCDCNAGFLHLLGMSARILPWLYETSAVGCGLLHF